MILCWFVIVVMTTFFSPLSYAQTTVKNDSAVEVQKIEPLPKESSENKDDAGKVSLDFRDADIKTVLQVLSLKSGVNIVTGPEVQGLISIQMNNVPWQQALEVIVATHGFASERKGDVIIVSSVENLKKRREDAMLLAEQETLETMTFTLNFAKAENVIASVEKMISERGNINFDERTNTIIVTDISSKVGLIEGVIKKLDKTTHQVLIEAKIVETTLTNNDNLGVEWTALFSASGSKRPILWPYHTDEDNPYAPGKFPSSIDSLFSYGTLNFATAQAVFEVLKTRSDTNILSNPRIVTLDNQAAEIIVGSQYPIPNYTYNEDQAKLQVSGWEYMDIGIIFNVTPHVNDAGFVTLDLEPKITAILDYVTVENTSLPRLSNESTKTSVMVKDHDTLVIGGLIKDQDTDTKKKVPIFGDVPILGPLVFQKSKKEKSKQDLLIFITPHIVTPKIPSQS